MGCPRRSASRSATRRRTGSWSRHCASSSKPGRPRMPERLGPPLDEPLFERLAIVGLGLIGSSIARAVKARGLARAIVAIDRDAAVLARVRALDLAADATADVAEGVRGVDLVILCVPLGAYAEVARQMAPAL